MAKATRNILLNQRINFLSIDGPPDDKGNHKWLFVNSIWAKVQF